MDPRKSATVTAPDLVKAFDEGRGLVDEEKAVAATNPNRIWLVLLIDEEVIEATDFPAVELPTAMESVTAHLRNGATYAAVILVGPSQPDLFTDAVQAISAIGT